MFCTPETQRTQTGELEQTVIAGLDPAIQLKHPEMPASSPGMTVLSVSSVSLW